MKASSLPRPDLWLLIAFLIVTAAVYWPGLSGGFLFDDFPNIVDNHGVQPQDASLASLVGAALSSPASEFKRPLASLSFAANYLATGIDPYWMKLTNLLIHLLNGWLVFLLARALLRAALPNDSVRAPAVFDVSHADANLVSDDSDRFLREKNAARTNSHEDMVAVLIAAGWMLLPINLTGVLYVVQRMESMANAFVLIGLIGYVVGRCLMLDQYASSTCLKKKPGWFRSTSDRSRGFLLCAVSATIPAAFGVLAKETAVMLPLYALLIEWMLFRFRRPLDARAMGGAGSAKPRHDGFIVALFLLVLALPMIVGMAWLLPGLLKPETWMTRDFTLGTRLLSEARIVVDYIVWTLLPTPGALSFYHDDFRVSMGLLTPWSTAGSLISLVLLLALMVWLRKQKPLVALGIALFLGCQLLTGTVLPLELIYEHRNYFASFGLLLAVVPMLAVPRNFLFSLPRHALLAGLLVCWAGLTALTARAWGNPLRLADDLAARAPQSPRAQYELGRTYIIYSHYDPTSPFTRLAYAPLERAAALPESSILPEQAMIFMNARMHLPIKDAWWESLIAKLKAHKPGVQDESSLSALTDCVREHHCDLPQDRMMEAFLAALQHPDPSARLFATYGDYAWNVGEDHALGLRMIEEAVKSSPTEPAYQITLIRMLAVEGRKTEATAALRQLRTLNVGGRLDKSLTELSTMQGMQ
ncbi:MAG: hypothetical protein ABI858_04710 [Pseudoxanthomonas sp.]